ncbi:MAG: hypothetical protein AAB874_03610, partial [Patescibacteria group bacterium]
AAYQKTLGEPLNFQYDARELLIEGQLRGDQVVSAAVTADPSWRLKGSGGKLKADAFGNIVIVPATGTETSWRLIYEEGFFWIPGLLMSIISMAFVSQSGRIINLFARKIPSLATPADEEKEY